MKEPAMLAILDMDTPNHRKRQQSIQKIERASRIPSFFVKCKRLHNKPFFNSAIIKEEP